MVRCFSPSHINPRQQPLTCSTVLTVSMGIRLMRQRAATPEAAIVLTATGNERVDSFASRTTITPVLAAVSPNRESGPCASAGSMPR